MLPCRQMAMGVITFEQSIASRKRLMPTRADHQPHVYMKSAETLKPRSSGLYDGNIPVTTELGAPMSTALRFNRSAAEKKSKNVESRRGLIEI